MPADPILAYATAEADSEGLRRTLRRVIGWAAIAWGGALLVQMGLSTGLALGLFGSTAINWQASWNVSSYVALVPPSLYLLGGVLTLARRRGATAAIWTASLLVIGVTVYSLSEILLRRSTPAGALTLVESTSMVLGRGLFFLGAPVLFMLLTLPRIARFCRA